MKRHSRTVKHIPLAHYTQPTDVDCSFKSPLSIPRMTEVLRSQASRSAVPNHSGPRFVCDVCAECVLFFYLLEPINGRGSEQAREPEEKTMDDCVSGLWGFYVDSIGYKHQPQELIRSSSIKVVRSQRYLYD